MVSMFFFFKQKTAYEMRISDWSSDVCSSDLDRLPAGIDREMRRDQRGQFVLDIGFHAETGGPGGLGRIDVEARALPEIIRLVVGHEIGRAPCRERVGQYV